MSNEKQFDFFISYTKSDERWAEWIAWQLEEVAEPKYSVKLQAWDFHVGGDFVHEMQKATTKASRTIAVLSPEFLEAKFTTAEWQAAFARDPDGELGLLVPIRVTECKPEGLLKARVYIDLVGLDEEHARAMLLKHIAGGRRKPAIAPQFPTTSKIRTEPSFPGPDVQVLGRSPFRDVDNRVSPSTSSTANRDRRKNENAKAQSKTVIKVFVSSPGDVEEEGKVLKEVVASINRTDGERDGFVLEPFLWETHVVPKIGMPPQDVGDQQTPTYEIYIGIMSARYGGGGTIKAFEDALGRWKNTASPWLTFYFNDNPLTPRSAEESRQLTKVLEFREQLESHGIVGSYQVVRGNERGFYEQLSEHLRKIVAKLIPQIQSERPRHDTTKYLQSLREATAYIDIRGLGVGAGRATRFRIDDLYITLTSLAPEDREAWQSGERRRREGERPAQFEQTLEDVLAKHDRLVVVGDPGVGKTTFLRRLAFALCQHQLGEVPAVSALARQLADRPLPILVKAHELARHLKDPPADPAPPKNEDAPAWLPHFLGVQSQENVWGLDANYFMQQLREGGCTVLLDGLDEAPDRQVRERVSRWIEAATTAFEGCRFVVTSRQAGYTGQVVLPGFTEARIEPLSPRAVETFLRRWCGEIQSSEQQTATHFEELLAAVRARPDIRRMARNPVMLTALAVVHWHDTRLPEQRADLYESIIQWLSRARERRPGRESSERTVELLQELALRLQIDPDGRKVQVPQRMAGEVLAPEFGDPMDAKTVAKAERFLHNEEIDSGIIVGRGSDVAFWHLTFQEFLAARALAARLDSEQRKLLFEQPERLFQPEWREMLALLAGTLYKQGKAKVDGFIGSLLEWSYSTEKPPTLANQARCAGLIGTLLRDLPSVEYQVRDSRYPKLLDSVMAIFDADRASEVDVRERIAAADALGQAGDPRLDRRLPDYWVPIPGGTFWMGSQNEDSLAPNYDEDALEDESPVHRVTLGMFHIARYPVTVGEFEQFIEDEGYLDPRWWSVEGFGEYSLPNDWDRQIVFPSRPVVGVSWYEASAYAVWTGCRLPSEAEWERAARGTDGRKFPWGTEPLAKALVNIAEADVLYPTPVGIFSHDATPEGVRDLGGNVLEWCAEWYADYRDGRSTETHGPTEGSLRVTRGGSWDSPARYARSAYRSWCLPSLRFSDLGFRLALSPLGEDAERPVR
jgi:formylglycine-generating enzyme required for sulfatase activity